MPYREKVSCRERGWVDVCVCVGWIYEGLVGVVYVYSIYRWGLYIYLDRTSVKREDSMLHMMRPGEDLWA
jgi:hypothetical protein